MVVQSQDRRKAPRVAVPMEMAFEIEGTWLSGRIADLSTLGMFVDTSYPLSEGARVGFRFVIPGTPGNSPVEGDATVVWTSPMVGAGLAFETFHGDGRNRIRLFVSTKRPR